MNIRTFAITVVFATIVGLCASSSPVMGVRGDDLPDFTFLVSPSDGRSVVTTDDAPSAIGPYSQGIVQDNVLYASGSIGLDKHGKWAGDDIQSQTRQALNNMKAILEAGGASLESVMKVTVMLKDMDDFDAVNAIYTEFFTQDPPARSCVQVARLPKDALVEIECIAKVF